MMDHVYAVSQSVNLPWTLQQYQAHAQMENVFYFVEKDGFLSVSIVCDEAEIVNIAVMPSAQRKGVATRLWDEATRFFEQRGVVKCFLEVRKSNEKARRFYERCKFQVIGERRAYYQSPVEDAIVYCWEKI